MIEIPGYTLLRPLGRGGMATVYLAVQHSLGREVALKVLAPSLAEDPAASERFLREASIAARLHHPHIIEIYDVGSHAGTPYIAAAFEPGGVVATDQPYAIADALRIVREIAAALDYAHAHGVVHRDVKPENILLSNEGAAVLSDFGIARAVEQSSGLTVEGSSVGTPRYMSPEQWRGEVVDGRADLYSLGIVLYQMLTAATPFQGSDGWAIGMQHMQAPIPRLPESAVRLQPLLDSLLAKEVSGRPQTGAALIARIDQLGEHTPQAITTQIQTPVAAPAIASRAITSRAKSARTMLVAVAVAITLLAAGWFGWQQTRASITATQTPSSANLATDASIAVLPFVDMSQAKDQEYFSDGLSEELLDRLAKIPQLRVAGRTSSFSFKGSTDDLRAIGAKLGVAHVLEGSVRKSGDRLRITAQLISVSDGFHQWSETYDRQMTDVFSVQDEIAVAVVRELQMKLLPNQQLARVSRHNPSPDAYDEYLLGRNFMRVNAQESFEKALGHFQRAVEIDPLYVDAYSMLAMAESFVAERPQQGVIDPLAARKRARAAVDRALELDPQSSDAYATRAFLRYSDDWDWAGAQADFDRAFKLDPANPINLLKYASLQATLGKLPDAIANLRRATEIDPMFNPPWDQLGKLYIAVGDHTAARAAISRALALGPTNPYPVRLRTQISLLEGDANSALTDYRASPSEAIRLGGEALAQQALGHETESRAALGVLSEKYASEAPYYIAQIHCRRGELDQAFEWLNRAYDTHDPSLLNLQIDKMLDGLRKDPRYQGMRVKMRFSE